MKTKKLIVLALGISSLAALPLMADGVKVQVNVPAPVIVPPAVTVEAVPESYTWDGTEYVGVVGSQYYYLGPGDVWLSMDAPRLVRFHEWEHSHADWRSHATRNQRYRHDTHGHESPAHESHESHEGDHHDGDHH